jgi:hypothetical protein
MNQSLESFTKQRSSFRYARILLRPAHQLVVKRYCRPHIAPLASILSPNNDNSRALNKIRPFSGTHYTNPHLCTTIPSHAFLELDVKWLHENQHNA